MYKEKAKELFDQMYAVTDPLHKYPMCFDTAKACTINQINNIIDALECYDDLTEEGLKENFGVEYFSCELQNMDTDFRYWYNVLIEARKL